MGQYTLHDFNRIGNVGFELTLPDRVIMQINELVKHVGSPNYIRTPVFLKTSKSEDTIATGHSRKNREKYESSTNPTNWDRLKKFQATKLQEVTGIDVQFNRVRSFLNKLTDKSSNDVTESILTIVKEVVESDEDVNSHMTRIGNIIFDIAATNRIFSKVYAEVYGALCSNYEFFVGLLEHQYNEYLKSYLCIENVSPDEDYNAFCNCTKQNDRRRALSSFYLNLYCSGVMPFEKLQDIMVFLLNTIIDSIQDTANIPSIDECTENVAILYSNELEYSTSLNLKNGKNITETIEHYATTKAKTYPGMTNKCTFKYMDMCGM